MGGFHRWSGNNRRERRSGWPCGGNADGHAECPVGCTAAWLSGFIGPRPAGIVRVRISRPFCGSDAKRHGQGFGHYAADDGSGSSAISAGGRAHFACRSGCAGLGRTRGRLGRSASVDAAALAMVQPDFVAIEKARKARTLAVQPPARMGGSTTPHTAARCYPWRRSRAATAGLACRRVSRNTAGTARFCTSRRRDFCAARAQRRTKYVTG